MAALRGGAPAGEVLGPLSWLLLFGRYGASALRHCERAARLGAAPAIAGAISAALCDASQQGDADLGAILEFGFGSLLSLHLSGSLNPEDAALARRSLGGIRERAARAAQGSRRRLWRLGAAHARCRCAGYRRCSGDDLCGAADGPGRGRSGHRWCGRGSWGSARGAEEEAAAGEAAGATGRSGLLLHVRTGGARGGRVTEAVRRVPEGPLLLGRVQQEGRVEQAGRTQGGVPCCAGGSHCCCGWGAAGASSSSSSDEWWGSLASAPRGRWLMMSIIAVPVLVLARGALCRQSIGGGAPPPAAADDAARQPLAPLRRQQQRVGATCSA